MRKLNAQLSELRGKAAEEQQASLYRLEEAVGRAEAQAADLSQQNEQLRKQLVEASERLPGMLRWVTSPPHLSHSPHAAALLQSRSTPATLLGHPCRFWLHARGIAAGLLWAAVRSKRANMIAPLLQQLCCMTHCLCCCCPPSSNAGVKTRLLL